MALLKLAALGAIGYAGYRYFQNNQTGSSPAYAGGTPRDKSTSDEITPIRMPYEQANLLTTLRHALVNRLEQTVSTTLKICEK